MVTDVDGCQQTMVPNAAHSRTRFSYNAVADAGGDFVPPRWSQQHQSHTIHHQQNFSQHNQVWHFYDDSVVSWPAPWLAAQEVVGSTLGLPTPGSSCA